MQTSLHVDFNSSAFRDRGKAGVSFIEETWEKNTSDSAARRGSNVGPDEGIRRLLLRFHNNKEE